jgi:lysophospholipid hydrolase
MFGNFEKPIFLELIKHIETIHLRPHQHLFMIGIVKTCFNILLSNIRFLNSIFKGDPDTNIYIVQNGQLRVYITDADGSTVTLKGVKKGESICSLLSFTEFLTGQSCVFKTVAACAEEESLVLRLPASAFQEVFEKHPDALVRAIQIIMVRLQRVTFLALHQYLGLSSELVKTYPHKSSGSSSPIKLRMREHLAKVGGIQNEVVLDSANPPTPPSSESGKRRMKDEKDYQYLVQSGIDGFVKLLGLEDSALLDGMYFPLLAF